jgi:hypothetical protein
MKTFSQKTLLRGLVVVLISVVVFGSCREDDAGFAITNDLRVLYVKVNGNRVESGVASLPVTSSVELLFSHGLDHAAFENALSITPALEYTVSYDETSSFATITPVDRLAYDVTYTISLPKGRYGANGETSKEDFYYVISTSEFLPPSITLSADNMSFFEGETVTVTATLNQVVFVDVTFDLVFTGTAEGDGVDFNVSATSITIPAQQTSATFTITSIAGDAVEGTETIIISLENIANATYTPSQPFTLQLGDSAPSLELKGVMHLNAGAGNTIRAFHLNVLKDIEDLSTYGIGINSNGSPTPPNPAALNYNFPAMSVSAGEQILVVRSGTDATHAMAYFDVCYSKFDHVLEGLASGAGISHNGNDAILLFNNGVAIETFGEFGVDGIGRPWEYTGTWGYKLGSEWIYGTLNCANNVGSGTTQASSCVYPMCGPAMRLVGVGELLFDGSTNVNRGKFVHLQAMRDIPNVSLYSVGLISNGTGNRSADRAVMPGESVKEGEHILIARVPDLLSSYFGSCINKFAKFYPAVSSGSGNVLTQNGDDAVELFEGDTAIELFGEPTYPSGQGPNQYWYYSGAWAYKVRTSWTYAVPGCTTGSTSTQSSSCPYVLCN